MEHIEKELKNQMKESNHLSYPDFDQMWTSIQQNQMKDISNEPAAPRPYKRKKFVMVAGLSFALLATPVYAALTFDWSSILTHKAGIQSALEQGLGQTIEQSIVKNGVALTVHTAFIDDNRTVLLYSLNPDSTWDGKNVSFDRIGLLDEKGNFIEGNYVHQWNEELGVFQGYFETDWVANAQTAEVEFMLENIHFLDVGEQSINYDPLSSDTQMFQIQKDGINSVALESFEQSENRILLHSSITFADPKMKSGSWVRIQAINEKNELIQEAERPVFGTSGASGEYTSQQIFETSFLQAKGTRFQLAYDRILETAEGSWNLNIDLSKKQLEKGAFEEALNIPLNEVPGGTSIQEWRVTPTQIRLILNHEQKHTRVPYMDYQLDVGGTLLNGNISQAPGQPNETELRFEMSGLDATSLATQPITLIAKHRVDAFAGDDKPVRLTDISNEHQSVTTYMDGYPIKWNYYMKDKNLYVESLSSNPDFGGVTQTYYLDGKDRNYGKPVMLGLFSNESNKNMDVYENFNMTELDIYISNYTTHKRDDELHVQLKSGK